MSHGATSVSPVVVDVAVNLTAIIRPEPDAGGYSASIPALPGCHTQGETSKRFAPTCAKPPRAGSPLPTMTASTAKELRPLYDSCFLCRWRAARQSAPRRAACAADSTIDVAESDKIMLTHPFLGVHPAETGRPIPRHYPGPSRCFSQGLAQETKMFGE